MNPVDVGAGLHQMSPPNIAETFEAVGLCLMLGLVAQMVARDPNVTATTLNELQASTLNRPGGVVGDIAAVRRLEDLIRGGKTMLDAVYHLVAEGMIENADPDDGWGA